MFRLNSRRKVRNDGELIAIRPSRQELDVTKKREALLTIV